MNDVKYKWVLYTIVFVILGTISIQTYWNYKNYLINKQQFFNDVQISLDNAVEAYYTELAKKNTIGFAYNSKNDSLVIKSILKKIDTSKQYFEGLDSIKISKTKDLQVYTGIKTDSLLQNEKNKSRFVSHEFKAVNKKDTLFIKGVEELTTRLVISFTNDSLNLKQIDSLFISELNRKKMSLNHGLSFKENYKDSQFLNERIAKNAILSRASKSTLLPKTGILKVHFSNETRIVLKRSLTGILISILLISAVISCLFYLLRIIKHQKQLADIKNDFISNITHEFKTPIATIGVALESIKDFNVIDNKEKTKTYLDMSNRQLSKLNVMVEKLLETAVLDSENLSLNKEASNLFDLITLLVNKHQLQTEDKTISFNATSEHITANIDAFHFENAINNIIDNAIKYGGDSIQIHLEQNTVSCILSISDNGTTLTKVDKARIFEKFYRIPKGNTHDVKGFGIGLYYSKKIIEKHNGLIDLNLEDTLTTFKISIPNE